MVGYNRNARGKGKVQVDLPQSYQECIEGICGNWNRQSEDDMHPRGSTHRASMAEVGDSWRVTSTDGTAEGG